ncbi:uncharacterized protein LOC142777220 isoform X2 [Rhipicephalus microplus]|uniref:uncharacterized protein LOC142777220 isoform X2 n=1 Tax=Rhipicephalus microplus TaxID=6941 RepID=UPI003F6C04C5
MDTTESDAAAPPANDDYTDELDDLFVNQESFSGGFSGSLVDHHLPCTASNDTRCQIVASIPKWNKILSWIELELCELPGEGRRLGLVHVRNICHVWPEENQIRQAAAMLYWLLETHRCVESVQIPQYNGDPALCCRFRPSTPAPSHRGRALQSTLHLRSRRHGRRESAISKHRRHARVHATGRCRQDTCNVSAT